MSVNSIRLLPDHVANQIAAGEVVQRPSSVVKELLENAIDAQATEIKLIVKEAGKILIQTVDNGKGMNPTDARLCLDRHTTSKIKDAKDLFDLHTKGFRGEALASIAAVAQVILKTKTAEEELGTQIVIEGSEVKNQEAVVTTSGTSIAVKNLFFNIPARRNFLKSDTVELKHISNEFNRVALAHPEIAFTFQHNGKIVSELLISNLRKRIVAILGKKINEHLVPIKEETNILTIEGFIAKPDAAKKKRGEQFFFANDRFIKSPYLHHAVMNAFEGLIASGYQPSYFLYLTIDPKRIDVNIHPTKTEIQFDDERMMYSIIRSAVKHSLGQYNVAPVIDFGNDQSLAPPYSYKNKVAKEPIIRVNPDFNPFDKEKKAPFKIPIKTKSWESLYTNADALESEITQEEIQSKLIPDEQVVTGKTQQIHQKYITSTIKSGIVYIHQHFAHQRILYETFLHTDAPKSYASQLLLYPVKLLFKETDIAIIQTIKDKLLQIGFEFEVEDTHVLIKGVPQFFSKNEVTEILEQMIEDIKNNIPTATSNIANEAVAKSLAKNLAIKSGVSLSIEEQEDIVNQLFNCKEAKVSPFGKPTFVTVALNEIDNKFKRT